MSQQLAQRLPHDSFLQKPKSIEKIVRLYYKGFRTEELTKAIYDYADQKDIAYFTVLDLLQN